MKPIGYVSEKGLWDRDSGHIDISPVSIGLHTIPIYDGREVEARIKELEDVLNWYAVQAEGCAKIHKEGDIGRNNLSHDAGKRARAALRKAGVEV